ncbi:MAG TPA: hypothetical protein EYP85_14410 [Armatimonadetes bacterium]|nr:hypothetical protein [Armatimonadota bacterium]
MRLSQVGVSADALTFMFAHEFVPERYHEEELLSGVEHSLQYPTRAPITGHYIDRNQIAVSVLFSTFADLYLRGSLLLTWEEVEKLWSSRWLYTFLRDHFRYRRYLLYAKKDGSFPNSPLNRAIDEVFEEALYPSSPYLTQPRYPVAHIIRKIMAKRGRDRNPYKEILLWVGDELIEEGFYVESTDAVVGVVPVAQLHPDVERMLTLENRAAELKARLERFQQREPELYQALYDTVSRTLEELNILYQRRFGL